MEYSEVPLQKLVDCARESSGEIGSLGNGRLINYETGKTADFVDVPTALFLASAREIVLELAKRIQQLERNS